MKTFSKLKGSKVKYSSIKMVSVGVDGIMRKLRVDPHQGLQEDDFEERRACFGDNHREPLKAKSWLSLFLAALDDFMLKVLIVAAVFSISFDMLLASPADRGHGKYTPYHNFFKPGLRALPSWWL